MTKAFVLVPAKISHITIAYIEVDTNPSNLTLANAEAQTLYLHTSDVMTYQNIAFKNMLTEQLG